MRRSLLRMTWLALALAGAAPAAASAAPVATFHPCADAPAPARCGSVQVPLDRRGDRPAADPRTLQIEFELYPRRRADRPSLGTIVDAEGGPGYSTTDSRDYYLELNDPLLDRRDMLLVDQRGTGLSGALDCPAFRATVADYVRRAGDCADQLGGRVDFYGTHAAVDDLADVLDALGSGAVDLYGDSYGSYLAQAFAVRHPGKLRSLVLDATYPLPGTDPAFGDLAEATRRALRLVCARRPPCAAGGEDPVSALGRLVERVRRNPVSGTGTDAEGGRIPVRIDEPSMVIVAQSGYANIAIYRDLLGAIRAFEAGDRAPLLRLVAENTLDPTDIGPVRGWSEALYLAVTCHDYPQLWDPAAPLDVRTAQLAQARATLPPATFAPFTATSWTGVEYEGATACLRWPGPRKADPPVPPTAPYPAVPTLVLNGDLDNITASSGARVVADRFPRSTFVELQNSVHVTALADRDDCAAPLVRRFVETLSAGDTSCATRIKEVRTVDRFPVTAADAAPASPRPGDDSRPLARRAAAAAAAMVADAIQRWQINFSGASRGLRGGRWSYEGDDVVTFTFDRARFADDVPVTGTATWNLATGAVRADVAISGAATGELTARWNVQRRLAEATLDGTLDGRALRATMLAP